MLKEVGRLQYAAVRSGPIRRADVTLGSAPIPWHVPRKAGSMSH